MAPVKSHWPYTRTVIPGEAGDPLAVLLGTTPTVSLSVFPNTLQQGDLRGDTRLSAGMTFGEQGFLSNQPNTVRHCRIYSGNPGAACSEQGALDPRDKPWDDAKRIPFVSTRAKIPRPTSKDFSLHDRGTQGERRGGWYRKLDEPHAPMGAHGLSQKIGCRPSRELGPITTVFSAFDEALVSFPTNSFRLSEVGGYGSRSSHDVRNRDDDGMCAPALCVRGDEWNVAGVKHFRHCRASDAPTRQSRRHISMDHRISAVLMTACPVMTRRKGGSSS